VPTLAVCRGTQVVNVSRGGTLLQHMEEPHRSVVHEVAVVPGTRLASVVGTGLTASCYHHQSLERLGDGVVATARSEDGTVEAIELADGRGWFLGLQWHPEDTAETDPLQHALLSALVAEGRG
jgi:putative glutamine amidotransferase